MNSNVLGVDVRSPADARSAAGRRLFSPQSGHPGVVLPKLNLVRLASDMIDRLRHHLRTPRLVAAAALLIGALGLAGCAGLGDSAASVAFVDPARYNLYDCKRIDADRKALAVRTAELNGLISKAETGVAGSVVAEIAYRNDYIAVRAQARLAEQAWQENRCDAAAPGNATPAAAAPAPSRSGGAVY